MKHYESIPCDPLKIADTMNEKLEKGVSEVKFLTGVGAINAVGQPVFIALFELTFESTVGEEEEIIESAEEKKNSYIESIKPKGAVLV